MSPRKIPVCWCDTVFLSQHKTGAHPLNTEKVFLCGAASLTLPAVCSDCGCWSHHVCLVHVFTLAYDLCSVTLSLSVCLLTPMQEDCD